jgi:hypothetical protein
MFKIIHLKHAVFFLWVEDETAAKEQLGIFQLPLETSFDADTPTNEDAKQMQHENQGSQSGHTQLASTKEVMLGSFTNGKWYCNCGRPACLLTASAVQHKGKKCIFISLSLHICCLLTEL